MRYSLGIEDAEDLITDLQQAFDWLEKHYLGIASQNQTTGDESREDSQRVEYIQSFQSWNPDHR